MKELLKEILEIPERANLCYQKNKGLKLPFGIPYLGMGASHFASLILFFCDKKINPQLASEYYYYLSKKILPLGVLISQSGESSEIVWNIEKFKKIIAIVNNPDSSLAKSEKTQKLIQLYAGEEKVIPATKTFFNTLIVLYTGLGINPLRAIKVVDKKIDITDDLMKIHAEKISKYINKRKIKGLYVLGSGPNIGTAYQGATVLSETTKLAWTPMSVAQYDHGPKETAENTVVIILNDSGKDKKRIGLIKKTLAKKSNSLVVELKEEELIEQLTPLSFIVQIDFIMNYLLDFMGIKDESSIGGKVIKVSDSIK